MRTVSFCEIRNDSMEIAGESVRFSRAHCLKKATEVSRWDVIVIGGGATGLGVALDAASRGYST